MKFPAIKDLDASMEEMMHGAVLPAFPSGMTEPRRQYTLNVPLRLER